jgi:hypothetical protein
VLAISLALLALSLCVDARAQENAGAEELMIRSHAARETWNGFPGFTADILASDGRHQAQGKITVSDSGELTLGIDTSDMAWVDTKLESLVAHRLADESADYDVSFADQDTQHPLGRLITINDDALMGSRYRVQDDIIREVHRTMRDARFTITVLDVFRNPDGKYLPSYYTVSYWDAKTGDLRSTSVVRDEWKRVGNWDLPARLLSVESSPDASRVIKDIRFENHQLLEGAATAAN